MSSSPGSFSDLKLLEKVAVVDHDNGNIKRHCLVLFTDGHTTFKAKTTTYELDEVEGHLGELDRDPVAIEQFYPRVERAQYVKAPNPLPDNCYVKTPQLLLWSEQDADKVQTLILSEVRVCEVLMNNPHPNVAKYFGCKQDGPSITGLCFERYHEDLFDRVTEKGIEGLSIENILKGIRQGIEHIHSLGYCHNDICLGNVMLRSDGTPVIVDFDSCQLTGAELGFKTGTPYFSDPNIKLSEPENDFYGLRRIEECLCKGDFANT